MSRGAEPVKPRRKTAARAANPAATAGAQDWASRLARVLVATDPPADPSVTAGLWADHATGDPEVDGNRLALLGLLAQRQAQQVARRPAIDLAPLPAWPDPDLSPVPPLHSTGLAGTSLISLCQGDADARALLASLPSWLASGAQEILVIELAAQPVLAARLLEGGMAPPAALRVVELSADGIAAPQAWNLGLRLAQFQHLICLGPGLRLSDGQARRPGARPGCFGYEPGPMDGHAFFLDIDRADIARVGGFHEGLPSADFALDELSARLMASGLTPAAPDQSPILPASPAPPRPDPQATLGATLSRHPALAGLRNRHLAALLPDWTGQNLRAFAYAGPGALGPRLAPASPPAQAPTALVAQAESRAMSDLVSARLGLALAPDPAALAVLLSRPAGDVTAMDAAVAQSQAPAAVPTRRVWLVLDLAPDIDLSPGSAALRAVQWLVQRAQDLGMSLVLRRAATDLGPVAPLLADLPQVGQDPALTRGFWPATLRDLVLDSPLLPHATTRIDADFVADHARFIAAAPPAFVRKPKLFIDAQHGLGNRLRAMASAATIADATSRELIVIWQPDAHCGCRFEDLFLPEGAVIAESFWQEAESLGLDLHNYMEVETGSAKDRPILLPASRDAYLRSAYPLTHPAANWDSENLALRRFRPNEQVMDLVASLGPNRPALSVHIRMEGGTQAEHLAYESPANWTAGAHRDIDLWRRRSHFHYFQTRIDQLVAQGLADSIFLASDTPDAYANLIRRYGARLSHLPRPARDRSVPALVHALADALLLSRAPRLLGSTWSSFSELAARLAPHKMTVELSGRDF